MVELNEDVNSRWKLIMILFEGWNLYLYSLNKGWNSLKVKKVQETYSWGPFGEIFPSPVMFPPTKLWNKVLLVLVDQSFALVAPCILVMHFT